MAGPGGHPRGPRRRRHGRPPRAPLRRPHAPGRGLPLPLLQQLTRAAAALAPRRGCRRCGTRRTSPARRGRTTAWSRTRWRSTSAGFLAARGSAVTFVRELLSATVSRPAQLGCFGLHEWAMVHGIPADDVRHAGWPLRLGSAGTDAVVERHGIRCSHFDAYRFFTDSAAPRNALRPTRDGQVAMEQPGCLHAGMDVYKWAFKLTPAGAERAGRSTPSTSRARSGCSTWRPRRTTCASSATPRCRSRRPRARPPTWSGSARSPSARTPCAGASSPCSTT